MFGNLPLVPRSQGAVSGCDCVGRHLSLIEARLHELLDGGGLNDHLAAAAARFAIMRLRSSRSWETQDEHSSRLKKRFGT